VKSQQRLIVTDDTIERKLGLVCEVKRNVKTEKVEIFSEVGPERIDTALKWPGWRESFNLA